MNQSGTDSGFIQSSRFSLVLCPSNKIYPQKKFRENVGPANEPEHETQSEKRKGRDFFFPAPLLFFGEVSKK